MTDSRLLNAVVGAVVTLLFSFTGFSPILGGAVAAWLEEGDKSASITVGALSGVIALAPLVFVVIGLVAAPVSLVDVLLIVVVSVLFVGSFVVGLGALGGYLAYYVMKDERVPGRRGS